MTPLVSVVVPTLGDTPAVRALLGRLRGMPDVEIVVVDGGGDPELDGVAAGEPPVHLLRAPAGRGRQMNAGARVAQGGWLLFLHADSRLPDGWLDLFHRADPDPAVAGGWFRLRIGANRWQARVIERLAALRVALFSLAYGDQGLFVRREVFTRMGGYRDIPLMEDVDFVRRLAREGALVRSPLAITTSARRWEQDGWFRRSARNLTLLTLYLLGASPAWLAAHYPGVRPGSDPGQTRV